MNAIEWAWTGGQAAAAAAATMLFVRGCRRPRREVIGRAALLGAGLLVLVVVLSPPVDGAVDASFAAHMGQHLMMIVVAAPMLVAADPIPSLLAALRAGLRRPLAAVHRGARGAGLLRPMHPVAALGAHMGALVVWHVPVLFDAAVENAGVHTLEHLSFVVTALWFWAPVLTVRGRRRLTHVGAVIYLMAAGTVGSAIGALLTFASSPLYAAYIAEDGHVRALHDQQLAGLLMWIPPGIVYLGVATVVFWWGLETAERRDAAELAAARNGSPPDAAPRVLALEDTT